MPKLIILLITTLTTLQSISQTALTTDTSKTCLPNNQLREMMRLNEIRKVQAKDLALVKEHDSLMGEKVAVKDSTIDLYIKKDLTNSIIISKYDSSVANLNSQIDIHKMINADLKRELKAANKKRVLNKIFYGGIAAIALVLLAIK